MKRFWIVGIIIILALAGYGAFRYVRHVQNQPNNDITIVTPVPSATITPTTTPSSYVTTSPTVTPEPTTKPLPTTINLGVPFTIQAPSQNWDAYHEETCEEAAMLMAQWFATHKQGLKEGTFVNHIPVTDAETSLKGITDWETAHLGVWKDTTAAQTKQFGEQYLNLQHITLIQNPSVTDIKQNLANGNVVVAPTAGRLLNNPHFTAPGPPYHMVLIRGYSNGNFITNDPGIREGEGYVYKEDVLMNAIHDWTGDENTINSGAKMVLVISPQS